MSFVALGLYRPPLCHHIHDGSAVMPATCSTPPGRPSPFIQNVYASFLFICIPAICMTSSSAYSDRHLSSSLKVYELVGSRWVDQGTAYCAGQLDDANQAYLVARSELDFNKIILSTAIRSNDVYQRQQGMHTSPSILCGIYDLLYVLFGYL